jgi:ADP-ribose pyrophosphatase
VNKKSMQSPESATREKVLLRTGRFDVEEVTVAGRDGRPRQRAIVRHPGSVAILPLFDDHSVCLIRNQRVAVQKCLIELPAGTLETGETPLQTAARELVEETGYHARKFELLCEFYLSPGVLDERMYFFVARGLTLMGAAREPGEEIDNFVVSWDRALELVDSRQIEDAKTIVGLLYFDRVRRTALPGRA